MKLTAPQWACLREAAQKSGCYAADSYQPTRKLVALGLVTRHERPLGQPVFRITEAGLAALND